MTNTKLTLIALMTAGLFLVTIGCGQRYSRDDMRAEVEKQLQKQEQRLREQFETEREQFETEREKERELQKQEAERKATAKRQWEELEEKERKQLEKERQQEVKKREARKVEVDLKKSKAFTSLLKYSESRLAENYNRIEENCITYLNLSDTISYIIMARNGDAGQMYVSSRESIYRAERFKTKYDEEDISSINIYDIDAKDIDAYAQAWAKNEIEKLCTCVVDERNGIVHIISCAGSVEIELVIRILSEWDGRPYKVLSKNIRTR